MSITLESPVTQPDPASDPLPGDRASEAAPFASPGEAYSLEERVPDWLKLPYSALAWTGLIGLVYVFYSFQHLHYTDLWSHVSYGRVIWMNGAIPATEPIMRLSAGMPFVDTAWGSQVIGYLAHRLFGAAGLQFLHAISITLATTLLLRTVAFRTHRFGWGFLACVLFLLLNWNENAVTRPQLAGIACYCGLLSILLTRWSATNWVLLPALFLLWTNLHGSFVIGLGLCLVATLGRAVDVALRSGLRSVWQDAPCRRLFVLTQLAFVATLLNPYGPALYNEVLTFGRYAPLADLTEWQPLTLRSGVGQLVALISVALLFVYRATPRRVTTAELVSLLAVSGAMLWSQRFMVWWAPLAVLALLSHGHAILVARAASRPVDPEEEPEEPAARKSVVTLSLVGLCYIFFAFTPFGMRVIHGEQAGVKVRLAANTPLNALDWYRKNPPQGQIFNPMEWGDILAFSGPRGLRIFVNSQAHLIHPDIWKHYMAVMNVSHGWDDLFDLYGINSIILDKAQRQSLIGRLRDHEKWKVSFEDNTAIIFSRRTPIVAP